MKFTKTVKGVESTSVTVSINGASLFFTVEKISMTTSFGISGDKEITEQEFRSLAVGWHGMWVDDVISIWINQHKPKTVNVYLSGLSIGIDGDGDVGIDSIGMKRILNTADQKALIRLLTDNLVKHGQH